MKKRMILMLVAVAVFIAAIGVVKYLQIRDGDGAGRSLPAAARGRDHGRGRAGAVAGDARPRSARWTPVHGVTVSADLPGIVERIAFESGRPVRRGRRAGRSSTPPGAGAAGRRRGAARARRLNLERMRGLREKGVIVAGRATTSAAAEHKQAEARVGEIRATIERKTIRAPFAGVLGIRQVNLGQYLNGGDPIVPLQSLDPIYVNFSVPQQEVGALRVGRRGARDAPRASPAPS